ncbi:molybdenum cofactor cytidylyltransferase [Clostridium sp. CX1]|uniref:Molybdenum cofactor cytidylyltransferase n=1 Tax=Clostridium tanneri TaxID=3037988 RepID=A0ABU4JU31_9CLOT|nr:MULTISPECIES: molybdenum cofactor cytidylyltransferase [unclassified Clostridium]MCT8977545.1 molybdenum cofactor cytidylyltransferase [Clostridium sp. CX1]MDW8801616.1 molybdenum cofactor cytidylyltransferase [Clostridium sp. A1-XYC3]
MISAIILASGFSNRMGENKLLLPYRDKPIIEHVIDVVLSCNFNDIVLICKDSYVLNLGKRKGIKTIINKSSEKGQSEAVKLGIKDSITSSGYMFFTGDQPLIQAELIKLLLVKFEENKDLIIIPKYNYRRGSPVIFPNKYKEELLKLEGDIGGRAVINNHKNEIAFVDITDKYFFFDVDTPEDYETLLTII